MVKKAVLLLFAFLIVLPIVYANPVVIYPLGINNPLILIVALIIPSLSIAIMVETSFIFSRLKADKFSSNRNRIVASVFFANLISVPIAIMLTLFPVHSFIPMVFGGALLQTELIVFVFEALFIYYFNKTTIMLKDAFVWSLLMNLISFFVGGLCTLILSAGSFLIPGSIVLGVNIVAFYFFYKLRILDIWKYIVFLLIALLVIELIIIDAYAVSPGGLNFSPYDCRNAAARCKTMISSGVAIIDQNGLGITCRDECVQACSGFKDRDFNSGVQVNDVSCTDGSAQGCYYCMKGEPSKIYIPSDGQ